jgi:hypothetical protein
MAARASALSVWKILLRFAAGAVVLSVGITLSGCASIGDSMSTAFADPAKYELWDCKQLEPERKNLANQAAQLEGLMAKARTGTAGPLVAEMAYRNDYIAVRGQQKFADEAWRKNNCQETAPAAAPAPAATPAKPAVRPKAAH